MGLDIGGLTQEPDWPKMGPSLLIESCLILAIRTARWSARTSESTASDVELHREIERAVHVAGRVFAIDGSSPRKKAWYVADEDDVPR
jgi:hypothetical protein